jgi:hypothetical protein
MDGLGFEPGDFSAESINERKHARHIRAPVGLSQQRVSAYREPFGFRVRDARFLGVACFPAGLFCG